MSKQVKLIRGQVRQIVQELLPEVLSAEHHAEIKKIIEERLGVLEAHVKAQMHEMNERQKDTLTALIRSVSVPAKS